MVSSLIIISNNNLALISDDNFETFSDLYLAWIDGVYRNVRVLTGEVVKLSWMPE